MAVLVDRDAFPARHITVPAILLDIIGVVPHIPFIILYNYHMDSRTIVTSHLTYNVLLVLVGPTLVRRFLVCDRYS